ncbi:hypothetical protein F5B21DRAFT_471631, partial [Xylaria acuta]
MIMPASLLLLNLNPTIYADSSADHDNHPHNHNQRATSLDWHCAISTFPHIHRPHTRCPCPALHLNSLDHLAVFCSRF